MLSCAALTLAACTTGSAGVGDTASPPRSAPAPSLTAITPITPTGITTAPAPPATGATTTVPAPTGSATGSAPTTAAPNSSAPAGAISAPRKHISLVVTYSGWNAGAKTAEVDAFAPGVLATHATCTLKMTRGGVTRTATRQAAPGPSSTQCGALTIPGSQLSAGAWQAVVTFASAEATGSSKTVTITVAG